MGTPTPERFQTPFGRHGRCTFNATWDQTDNDDLENELVLRLDEMSDWLIDPTDAQKPQKRMGIISVDWSSSLIVSGDLEWDSVPTGPDSRIMSFPTDATAGHISFASFPDGCMPDPNPLSPGNAILTTRNALPGDEVNFIIVYKEKGAMRP